MEVFPLSPRGKINLLWRSTRESLQKKTTKKRIVKCELIPVKSQSCLLTLWPVSEHWVLPSTNSPISLKDGYPLVLSLTDVSPSFGGVARTAFSAWLPSRFRRRAPGIAFSISLPSVGGADNSGLPPPAIFQPPPIGPDPPQCSLADPERTKIQIDETKCTHTSDSSLLIGLFTLLEPPWLLASLPVGPLFFTFCSDPSCTLCFAAG